MITTTQMYWLVMLDSINNGLSLLLFIGILIGMVIAGISISLFCENADYWEKKDFAKNTIKAFKGFLIYLFCYLLLVLTAVLIPSTKQMATILVAPKIINNEEVQKLPNQVVKLANEWLVEISPKKQEVK